MVDPEYESDGTMEQYRPDLSADIPNWVWDTPKITDDIVDIIRETGVTLAEAVSIVNQVDEAIDQANDWDLGFLAEAEDVLGRITEWIPGDWDDVVAGAILDTGLIIAEAMDVVVQPYDPEEWKEVLDTVLRVTDRDYAANRGPKQSLAAPEQTTTSLPGSAPPPPASRVLEQGSEEGFGAGGFGAGGASGRSCIPEDKYRREFKRKKGESSDALNKRLEAQIKRLKAEGKIC